MRYSGCWLGLLLGCSPKAGDPPASTEAPPADTDDTDRPDESEGVPIYVGDVELRTDEQVTVLEGYEVIQGSLGIFDGVTDLGPLHTLEEVTGSLRIEDTTTLPSLAGLEALTTIGADLGIQGSTLTSLDGLDSLTSVEGLQIDRTESLQDISALSAVPGLSRNLVLTDSTLPSLDGLDGLTEVRGYLNIDSASALTSLRGLEGVAYVGKTLFLVDCPELQSLEGLGGLRTVNESVAIADLPQLERIELGVETVADVLQIVRNPTLGSVDLTGLQAAGELEIHGNAILTSVQAPALTEVEGWLQVDGNDALSSIGDFSALQRVGERVSVTGNSGLTALAASFPALREVGENLDVHDNPQLPACEVDALAEALSELGGTVVNTGNDEAGTCDD